MPHACRSFTTALLTIGAAACSSAKKDATEAVDRADRFVTAMKTEAAKVLPEQTTRLVDSLKLAKDQFAAADYKTARVTAIHVANRAVSVAKLVGPKRNEYDSTYKVISHELTYPVRQVVAKMREYATSGRLPRGMNRATFDSLKTHVPEWEGQWKAATDHYESGQVSLAAAKATEVKSNVIGAMKMLGMVK